MERKDTDLAWCAGFFDGEGHVSCHRSYPNEKTGRVSAQLYANVPQMEDNKGILDHFQSIIGFGKIKGPYKTKLGRAKYTIQFGVNEVEKLFLLLKPYLQEEKTLDFQRALVQYWTFDHTATPDDHIRAIKRNRKKGKLI